MKRKKKSRSCMPNSYHSLPALNMFNISRNNSKIEQYFDIDIVIQQIFYIVAGFTGMILNFWFSYSIIINKNVFLQKVYFLIITLSAGDLLTSFAFASAGIRRLIMVINNQQMETYSSFQCLLTFPVSLFIIAPQITLLTRLTLAIDRLIVNCSLQFYKTLNKRYIVSVITFVISYCIVSYVACYYMLSVYGRRKTVSALCINWIEEHYRYYKYGFDVGVCFLSGFIILIALLIFKYHGQYSNSNISRTDNAVHNRHLEVAKMILITLFIELFLLGIPNIIVLVFALGKYSSPQFNRIIPYLWAFGSLSSNCNVFVYVWQSRQVRDSMKLRFCSKKVSPVIELDKK